MSGTGADEIECRSAIAAVNSTTHLRVYTQAVFGQVRESVYESSWINGTSRGAIATAKPGSPIAAASEELQRIRVYYLSGLNTIMEATYDSGSGWTDGSINSYFFQVAPYSKVAVCFLPGTGTLSVRLYAQMIDNTIQEFALDGPGSLWRRTTNLGPAMPGTHIACISYRTSQLSIRLYHQSNDGRLVEKGYDAYRGWFTGGYHVSDVPPRVAIAATSFNATFSSIDIRVFHAGPATGCWRRHGITAGMTAS